jgi:hypothetical protein
MEQHRDPAYAAQAARHPDSVSVALRPRRAVLELDGHVWRRATAADAETLDALAASGVNRILFTLPRTVSDFESAMGGRNFGQPMLCLDGPRPVAGAATTQRNRRSLNLQVLFCCIDPSRSALPLAMYVRHLIWSIPLHRLYVQLPLIKGADDYVAMFEAVGFTREGIVGGHALIDGRPTDVMALGLLRREFEDWCRTNESRLSL